MSSTHAIFIDPARQAITEVEISLTGDIEVDEALLHELVEAETVRIVGLPDCIDTFVLVDDEPTLARAHIWRWRQHQSFIGNGVIIGREPSGGAYRSPNVSLADVHEAVAYHGPHMAT